jgi:iron complex outermembrane receptor protein
LNLSATYWRVGVKGIIAQIGQTDQMNLCFNGNAVQCAFIQTLGQPWAVGGVINQNLVHTAPTLQTTPQVNLAGQIEDGIDYEASYRFAVNDAIDWGVGGDVTIRMLATNVMKNDTNPGLVGSIITENAGSNGGATPHWKVFFTQGYDADSWGLFVNERWFSEGVINRNWFACASACPAPVDSNHPTVSSNYMPGELYFDIGGHYDLSEHSQLYFKIDNLTNQNPGNAIPFGPANQSYNLNPGLYDVLGRFYHIGFRLNN